MTAGGSSLRTRLRYRFDNALSRGPIVVIAYLGVLTLAAIVVAGLIAILFGLTFGDGDENLFEAIYQSLLRMLDPGTFSGDASWSLRALTLVVTIVGIILGGSLIGLIANAVDQRVEELQRGRGQVVERNHTLILGWSPLVPQIISELCIANESEKDAAVVVLTKGDKGEADEAIESVVADTKTTRVVVRNGDPALPADLERVCAVDARSIIAVRDEDGDASVIKAVLAVRALDPRHEKCHVVAELNDPDNARTLRAVSNGRVVTMSSDAVVAEVTAQACYQSGLAAVFADLLDFDGDEVYFAPASGAVGATYAQTQLAFEASSLVGLFTADREVVLNPPADRVIEAGDELILIASDDSAIVFTGLASAPPAAPSVAEAAGDPEPVRVLIVGWSSFGARVLKELDEFLAPGSTIHVQVDTDLLDPAEVLPPGPRTRKKARLQNATLTADGGRGGPEDLLRFRDETFDQVIVLAYRDLLSASDADARTLLALLTLRMMWPADDPDHVRIVAELVDQRNTVIATPAGIDDLIVSDALASLMMAQLSERAELLAVFEDLFDPDGAVVLLEPATNLVGAGRVPMASIVAAGSARGMSVFGYRVAQTGDVVMNPPKSSQVELRPGDAVLAIGERT